MDLVRAAVVSVFRATAPYIVAAERILSRYNRHLNRLDLSLIHI